MKVLITFLTYGKDVFGGIERATYNFSLGLQSIGIKVFVFTGLAYTSSYTYGSIEINASQTLKKNFSGDDADIFKHYYKNSSNIVDAFLNYYNKIEPDLVICVDHLWGILPILNIKIACKKVLWLHVIHNEQLLSEALNSDYEIFAVSEFLANNLKKFTHKKINILHNSIVYKDFETKWDPKNIIFCNSRISPEKRVGDAVLAFKNFSLTHDNYELHLCKGNFPFGKTIESLTEIQEIMNSNPGLKIKFHENLKWEEIPILLSKSSAVILPTSYETFGLAALEAMASGVPLITTDAGNLPYLTKQSCYIVPVGNIEKLTDSLCKAVNKNNNNFLGKEYAKFYDYKKIAFNFINALNL